MAHKFSKSRQTKRKPSWAAAPGWARWLALEKDGEWCWHETEPEIDSWCTGWMSDGQSTHAATEVDPDVIAGWKTSCEERSVGG